MHVLIVDDDRAIRESLQRALSLDGYDVEVAPDGLSALRQVQQRTPDLVVLDIMMPGVDGLALLRRLRADGVAAPVLLLTARDAVDDRVDGLDVGADDYLVKPFAIDELRARMRALLRRTAPPADDHHRRFADVEMDLTTLEVRRGGRRIDLTRTEFELLTAFLDNPNRVLTRDVLRDRVWGDDVVASNTLEVYVGYLRRKLEAEGEPRLVHTARGFGYVLRAP
jgi:two-component system, OmpR family, response regulator MprA